MHIDITPENLLIQLGYSINEVMLEQMNDIFENTKGFDKFSKHILNLSDELERHGGYVGMSNSFPYLKAKTDNADNGFKEALDHWSNKYKVALQKVEGKDTYYIIGQD